jgi:hypothetical protein
MAVISRSRSLTGAHTKPTAIPGATRFDRLSTRMQWSGASAVSARVAQEAVDGVLDQQQVELFATLTMSCRRPGVRLMQSGLRELRLQINRRQRAS